MLTQGKNETQTSGLIGQRVGEDRTKDGWVREWREREQKMAQRRRNTAWSAGGKSARSTASIYLDLSQTPNLRS